MAVGVPVTATGGGGGSAGRVRGLPSPSHATAAIMEELRRAAGESKNHDILQGTGSWLHNDTTSHGRPLPILPVAPEAVHAV